ncbi:hypothetical protein TNIN_413221, partial [Trichonephila inaurata madagascariensis]
YSVKDRQPFIDCSKVLVSPTMTAIPDTVDNTTLSINSVRSVAIKRKIKINLLMCKEPVSIAMKQHKHVNLPVSLTFDEDEVISN